MDDKPTWNGAGSDFRGLTAASIVFGVRGQTLHPTVTNPKVILVAAKDTSVVGACDDNNTNNVTTLPAWMVVQRQQTTCLLVDMGDPET